MTELSLQSARLGFRGRAVLDDVSLAFPAGQVTAVLGPNGAGKSTLLRSLAGVLPLLAGRARLGDVDLDRLSRRERARKIASLPQQGEAVFAFRVEEVVLLGRYAVLPRFGPEGPEDRARVAEVVEALDLGGLRGRRVDLLSGGERQRVFVARTLASPARVVLLDEPAANLDPPHALALFGVLRAEAARGRTIVVALHDLSAAARRCDRAALLAGGRVVAEGAAARVVTPEVLVGAFGGQWDERCGLCGGRP
jgi:iron complex transport system ATP-binding protein